MLVFCSTRDSVRHLQASLLERGFASVSLSGEMGQRERTDALQALRDGRARVCVATDVAARGIDLPGLSLVVHVEVPRDAEVLQHRSGRTGRAGSKGTAVIIVPYPRRRRVDGMLRGARIPAEWVDVPTAEAIQAQDREHRLERHRDVSPLLGRAADRDQEQARELEGVVDPDRAGVAHVRHHQGAEGREPVALHLQGMEGWQAPILTLRRQKIRRCPD